MKVSLDKIRNIGIMAHIDAGKTTTSERILFYSGRSHKIGDVDDGNTVMDWMPQEQERGITITAAATTLPWKDYHINLIDTPGHVDFTIEVERSLRVLDGAILVLDSVNGVEPQSEVIWRQITKYKVPTLCFVNKMDRVGANFEESLRSIEQKLGVRVAQVQIPIGSEESFSGIIDVFTKQAFVWDSAQSKDGSKFQIRKLTPDEEEIHASVYANLVERIAETDDELTESFLEGVEIESSRLRTALRKATIDRKLIPAMCGSAFKNKGVQQLMDSVLDYLPAPYESSSVHSQDVLTGKDLDLKPDPEAPLVGIGFKVFNDSFAGFLVFVRVYTGTLKVGEAVFNPRTRKRERVQKLVKLHANQRVEVTSLEAGDIGAVVGLKGFLTGDTVCREGYQVSLESIVPPEPVISIVVEAKNSTETEKLNSALGRLVSEDPSTQVKMDPETGQTLLSGMGELHLEILVDRLKREFGLVVNTGRPQVSYREYILSPTESTYQSSHLNAGASTGVQTAASSSESVEVVVRLVPQAEFGINVVKCDTPQTKLPKDVITQIAKAAAEEALGVGPILGFPILGVDLNISKLSVVGSIDEVGPLVRTCVIHAIRDAVLRENSGLLEPICKLEVFAPDQFVGAVVSDINGRRGRVNSIDMSGTNPGQQTIKAEVPLANTFGYATDLRSLTQGRASFFLKVDRYEPLMGRFAEELLERFGRI